MKKDYQSLYILWVFMLGIGLLICSVFYSLYEENSQFIKRTSTVEATITSKEKTAGKVIPIYEYNIKYVVNNHNYNGTIKSFLNYQTTQMEIFYETTAPAWILEKKGNSRHFWLFIISLCFPLYIIYYMIATLFKLNKARKLLNKNNYIVADVLGIKKCQKLKKGNWYPYCLECQYQNKLYQSYCLTLEQTDKIGQDKLEVKVYLDEFDNYYVDTYSIKKKEG